jgi:hypothetical protein
MIGEIAYVGPVSRGAIRDHAPQMQNESNQVDFNDSHIVGVLNMITNVNQNVCSFAAPF